MKGDKRDPLARGPRPPRRPPGKLPPPPAKRPSPPGKTPLRGGSAPPGLPRKPPIRPPTRGPAGGRAAAPPVRTRRKKEKRGKPWIALTLAVVLFIGLAVGGYFYIRGRSSLPQIDGTLELSGLSAPVEVLRDVNGVPHLFASSREDLARANGYVHAQDRLFQMEILRRWGMGRMAELFGASVLPLDTEARRLALSHAARAEWERMDPTARSLLEAYADGVNAYRVARADSLPPEFQILHLDPEPWQPTDSLVIGKWMASLISYNSSVEILRAHLAERTGEASAYLLTGQPPPPAEAPVASRAAIPAHPGRLGCLAASNAWVVSGDRTASGRPLLASDPHLPLPIPGIWYEIHLNGGGLNVAGAGVPGIPLVLIGRNERIAWGLTASFADVQDTYVETLNPANPRQYAVGEEWAELDAYSESIAVAGGAPVTLETFRTRHGVLVSDQPREGRILALRWDALWAGDNTLAFLLLNQANNWMEFTEALRRLGAFPLSFVYADIEGNIGLFPSGDIPVRQGFDGTMPVEGQSGAHEWLGVLPHERKPFFYNPEQGYLVSANQRLFAEDPEYSMGRDELAPFRAERISSLLTTAGRVGTADFARMQADQYDGSTGPILRYVVSLDVDTEESKRGQDLLRTWDGKMAEGPAPALYQAFYSRLLENTFQDELGEDLFGEFLDFLEIGYYGGIYAIIDDAGASWWDDTRTPTLEDRSAVFRKSLVEAMDLLSQIQGSEPRRWDWASVHGITFEHPLGRRRPWNWLFNRGPVRFGGTAFTLANAVVSLREPFRVTAGTSFRFIADLDNANGGMAIVPTGASGHPLSSHYFDQNRDWLAGQGHVVLLDRARVEAVVEGKLSLVP